MERGRLSGVTPTVLQSAYNIHDNQQTKYEHQGKLCCKQNVMPIGSAIDGRHRVPAFGYCRFRAHSWHIVRSLLIRDIHPITSGIPMVFLLRSF